MAANNYFGFAHSGTQYPAQTAYTAGATGYTVGPSATPAYAATQGAARAAYETTYQAVAAATPHAAPATYAAVNAGAAAAPVTAAYEYSYATARPAAPAAAQPPQAAAAGYDSTKTYYQQAPSASDNRYQGAAGNSTAFKGYNAGAANSQGAVGQQQSFSAPFPNQNANANKGKVQYATYSTQTNYGGSGAVGSGSPAVVGGAPTVRPPNPGQVLVGIGGTGTGGAGTWAPFRKAGTQLRGGMRPRAPPKPQQLHYCEVCKISCAGPQTYMEHLEGQKHKKKEQAAKVGAAATLPRGGSALRCELCDVTCTGSDAYAAHIRGAKHQKVVKLHQKLGKPIPSTEPTIISNKAENEEKGTIDSITPGNVEGTSPAAIPAPAKKPVSIPKINFVGGTQLKTTTAGAREEKLDAELDAGDRVEFPKLPEEKDVQPVGADYIDEIKNDEGKVISFSCKLCECRFNDPNAKEMHLKGRRHRLQYKKKVDPNLPVEIKPSLRMRRIQEDRARRQQVQERIAQMRAEKRQWHAEMRMLEEEEHLYWEERRRYEDNMEFYYMRRMGRLPPGPPPPGPPLPPGPPRPGFFPPGPPMPHFPGGRRPETNDDRHVIHKHGEIYPKEEELQAVHKIVGNSEKALKLVSDYIAEVDAPPDAKEKPAAETKDPKTPEGIKKEGGGDKKDTSNYPRVLKGVMRVGNLAKGLLLRGDSRVRLVVLCSEKPTRALLERVADSLPKQFAVVAPDDKYQLKMCVEEAAIVVSEADCGVEVHITLTSPVMREQLLAESHPEGQGQGPRPDPPDVLDKDICLEALAELRHAKWFQAKANGLQSCVMVIRILRDLCTRVPTWAPLNCWGMELLCEKVISSAGTPLSPGEAVRRVFEALAGGILLPGGPGLMDPCEKDAMDAAAPLSNQEREDITASAQHALRLIAFHQIYKVLGIEKLPPPKSVRRASFGPARKRRRDNNTPESNENEEADGKKDKKEEESMETEVKEAVKCESPPK